MGLWIAMAVLAAAASLSVLVPLYRSRATAGRSAAQALAIYRDQLGEVDRDVARGVIAEGEAAAARTEIARRLIRAGDEARDDAGAERRADARRGDRRGHRHAARGARALSLHRLARTARRTACRAPRRPIEQQDIATLVARVEAHLAANPDDGKRLGGVAPVYMRLGRFDDAVKAYGNVIRLLGSTRRHARPISARRWSAPMAAW